MSNPTFAPIVRDDEDGSGPCHCGLKAEVVLYRDFATYNASTDRRPRRPMCGRCASKFAQDGTVERVSPFAFVVRTDTKEPEHVA